MNNQVGSGSSGYTLIEVLTVISIIGALASIAIPHYIGDRERALEAACHSNRRNIESEEIAYFASNNMPNLSIGEQYACSSGGVYAWLVSDPRAPDYPKVACSVHYAGLPTGEINAPIEKTGPEAINELIKRIRALDLNAKGKDGAAKLINKLEGALREIDRGRIPGAEKKLDAFKGAVKTNKKIAASDKAALIEMTDEILKQL